MWHTVRFNLLMSYTALACLLAVSAHAWSSSPRRVHVDCNAGESLQKAVSRARSGTVVRVSGTCRETVIVRRDGISIVGDGEAVITADGAQHPQREAVLNVIAAKGVVLRKLIVSHGSDQGVIVQKGARVSIESVQLLQNATNGLSVDASYAELTDVSAQDNGAGLDVFTGSTVIARGEIYTRGNRGPGVAVNGNSTLELRGARVYTEDNGGDGVLLVNNANLLILSFPESQGSGVTSRNNGGSAGMFVANSNVSVVGSQFVGSGANRFDVSGNGVGILLISSNLASPFATAQFNLETNGVGLIVTDNSDVIVNGGLNVSENFGPGILADGAGVLRLQQNADNPTTISGNRGPDLVVSFGSRIVLEEGVSATVVACDPSVLASPASICGP